MKKAAGYLGVPTGDRKRQKEAIRRSEAIEAWCLEHDAEIVEWLKDEEDFGAIAFGSWLNVRKVDMVVAADSKDVSDDMFEYYAYKCVLRRRHSDLESVDMHPDGRYQLYENVLEKFIDVLCDVELKNSPRTKTYSRKDKAARGEYIGGNAPMGYRVENRKLIVNPEEGPAVLLIMQRKHEGKSMLSTVDALNKNGYKTRKGGAFAISTVQSIWNNEMLYRGYTRYGKDGEWIKGQHEAILKDEGGI